MSEDSVRRADIINLHMLQNLHLCYDIYSNMSARELVALFKNSLAGDDVVEFSPAFGHPVRERYKASAKNLQMLRSHRILMEGTQNKMGRSMRAWRYRVCIAIRTLYNRVVK